MPAVNVYADSEQRTHHGVPAILREGDEQTQATARPALSLSLREFMRGAWHVIEPATPLVWGWHLDCQCDHAEALFTGGLRRLIVNVPPGACKSIVWAVMLTAWGWTRQPHHRYLVVSCDADLATRDSQRVRDIMASAWFTERWGHRVRIRAGQNTKVEFATEAGGVRLVRSMQGGVTGRRGDTLIIDDPQAARDTRYSPAYREEMWTKVQGELLSRLNDKARSPIVVVQQRLHTQDVTGHLLELGGWDRLCIPMERRVSVTVPMALRSWRDPRTDDGESYHPEMVSPAVIAEERVQAGRHHEAQNNQDPSVDDGSRVKADWFRRWSRTTLPGSWETLVASWDLTSGKARKDVARGEREGRRSFVVGQIWGRALGQYFLLDQVRGQWEVDPQIDAMVVLSEKWPAVTVALIEDAALGATSEQHVAGRMRCQIVKVPLQGRSKEERVDDVTPILASGCVHLPPDVEAPWAIDWVRRVSSFPSAEPDDEVDAMTQALDHLRARTSAVAPEARSIGRHKAYAQKF